MIKFSNLVANSFFQFTFISLSFASLNLSYSVKDARAQSCNPLPLVGGTGSEVNKTVSQPNVPGPFGIQIAGNNWNTDWAVPGNKKYNRFIVTVSSEEGTALDLKMNLKYSDQTSDEFYNQKAVPMSNAKPLKIEGKSRSGDKPYQVNLFVGGVSQIGKSYQASVVGCM